MLTNPTPGLSINNYSESSGYSSIISQNTGSNGDVMIQSISSNPNNNDFMNLQQQLNQQMEEMRKQADKWNQEFQQRIQNSFNPAAAPMISS